MIKPTLDDIPKLSSSGLGIREFGQAFLESVSELTGADASAIWFAGEKPLRVIAQHSKGEPTRLNLTQEAHDQLLSQALSNEQPVVARSAKNGKATDGPLLLLGTYDRFGSHVLELIFGESLCKEDEASLLELVTKSLKMATEFCPNELEPIQQLGAQPAAPPGQMKMLTREEISNYLTSIHSTLDKKMACSNVANETRRILDCDRVSVLLKHRGKFRLYAISGQPSVNRRSNNNRMLEQLAQKILKTKQAFWYPDQTDIPPQISSILDDYLALTATRSFIVDPIFEKIPDRVEDPESNERKSNAVVGGIVYEHCNELWSHANVSDSIGFATEQSGNSLRNANRHNGLFLYPVWNLLGKSRVLTAPRILPKTLLVLSALVLASLVLYFWKVDFAVNADGVLVPKKLSPVYARVDGDLNQLLVAHGSEVKKGQTVAILRSHAQELSVKEAESNLRSAQKRLEAIKDRRFDRQQDEATIEENINSLNSQIESYKDRLKILSLVSKEMAVKSPISGRVISWDLRRQLEDRPIQRGNVLMEVADVKGEWELELHLEDRRIGHLRKALAERGDNRLPVTFLLAANTEKRYSGTLVELAPTTELTADNVQAIKIRVEIDSSEIEISQARTGITAKIICGKSSLGYYWFHDINEFLHKNVYFYFR